MNINIENLVSISEAKLNYRLWALAESYSTEVSLTGVIQMNAALQDIAEGGRFLLWI